MKIKKKKKNKKNIEYNNKKNKNIYCFNRKYY